MMRRTLSLATVLALAGTMSARADMTVPSSAPASDTMLKPGADRRQPLRPIQGQPLQDKTTINPILATARPTMLRREGTFMVDRTGRLAKSADGDTYQFNLDPVADPLALPDPPIALHPDLALMIMQQQVKTDGPDQRFRVTGMVTEYMGRNYLLLQKVIAISGDGVPATAPATTPAAGVAVASTAPATQPESPRMRLNEMLRPGSERRRTIQAIPGQPQADQTSASAIAPGGHAVPLRREGSYIVDRTGRLTKSADGQHFEFNFEADASAMTDPPMVLLPNLALMLMQDQVRLSGRDQRFRVTGMVTEYMGRNYLLMQKAITVSD